jgi:hypothetical protein
MVGAVTVLLLVRLDNGRMTAATSRAVTPITNHHGCRRDSRAGRRIGTPDRSVATFVGRVDERGSPDHGALRTREC